MKKMPLTSQQKRVCMCTECHGCWESESKQESDTLQKNWTRGNSRLHRLSLCPQAFPPALLTHLLLFLLCSLRSGLCMSECTAKNSSTSSTPYNRLNWSSIRLHFFMGRVFNRMLLNVIHAKLPVSHLLKSKYRFSFCSQSSFNFLCVCV